VIVLLASPRYYHNLYLIQIELLALPVAGGTAPYVFNLEPNLDTQPLEFAG
jgi:hypothetical protein